MNNQQVMALEDASQITTYRKMPIAVERGEGAWVWDADGRAFLDFYGGHCVALLGHAHPAIAQAISDQAGKILFYSNAVYSPVRALAAKALSDLAPEGVSRIFFCNSGTEANETALKLARKTTGRSIILAMEQGFHGRTLGSLAATWSAGYRDPYMAALGPTEFVPFGDADALERRLAGSEDIAAVIIEPIQSMAGIVEAEPAYFRRLRELCDASGTMLILDEIQTGVGRTGTFSISEQFGMTPDLITLAKSLGSGVPVGAVLVSDAIADKVEYGDQGTTFGGGMLAMAAVSATLSTIIEERLMDRARHIERRIRAAMEPLGIVVRGRGALLGLHLGRSARPIIDALLHGGIIVGGASDPRVIRLMPPLVTTDQDIDRFVEAIQPILATTSDD